MIDVAQIVLAALVRASLAAIAGPWILGLEWRHQAEDRRAAGRFEASMRVVAAIDAVELESRDWRRSPYARHKLTTLLRFHVAEVRVYRPDPAIEAMLAEIEDVAAGLTSEDRETSPAVERLSELAVACQEAVIADLSA